MQGPEDSKNWKTTDKDFRETRICRGCNNVIHLYHCEDTGCPWCMACSRNINPKKEKK